MFKNALLNLKLGMVFPTSAVEMLVKFHSEWPSLDLIFISDSNVETCRSIFMDELKITSCLVCIAKMFVCFVEDCTCCQIISK